MFNIRIAGALFVLAALSPCTLQAQVTVLHGGSLPTDQGWSVQTNVASPDVSTDGTVITANTIGTPQGTSARLLFHKDLGVVGGYYWVEFRIKLNELGAIHNSGDSGMAVFAIFHPETTGGTSSDRSRMVYLDSTQVGWGTGSAAFQTDTMSDFQDYRLEYDDGGPGDASLRLYINDTLRLSDDTSNVPTGTIAFGDMTQDSNLNSRYQVEWVRVFRDCNRNNVEDGDEITSGSADCDGDGVLDECQLAGNDCNVNSVPDICDLNTGSTDCDANGLLDECEAASFDCNGNGLHDACDIQSGFSLDGNGDGFPDECSTNIVPNGVAADPTGIDKSRFISFIPPPPPDGDWATSALRIRLVSLHHVDPPYSGGPTVPFTLFEGLSVWVGEPSVYWEAGHSPTTFRASFTQCAPLYRDWTTVGLLHVTGTQIVPSSVYMVENVSHHCQGQEDSCGLASSPLEVRTARWGDVWDPYNPPSATVQPDFGDVSAIVDKFRGVPGAPIKARVTEAGFAPNNAWGQINAAVLSVDIGFAQMSIVVNAYRGLSYIYEMGKCANSSAACTEHTDCGANGPCELYCPD